MEDGDETEIFTYNSQYRNSELDISKLGNSTAKMQFWGENLQKSGPFSPHIRFHLTS